MGLKEMLFGGIASVIFGPLGARSWLAYLDSHASSDSLRIR